MGQIRDYINTGYQYILARRKTFNKKSLGFLPFFCPCGPISEQLCHPCPANRLAWEMSVKLALYQGCQGWLLMGKIICDQVQYFLARRIVLFGANLTQF